MFSLDLLAFFLASVSTLALIYYKVPTSISQQGIALLLVTLIILSKKIVSSSQLSSKLFRSVLLILSSLFVQLLVISSGGFYSPFLILLHLYTLGVSFLLKIGSAISFLLFSLIVLIVSTLLNQTLLSIFQQDPGSVLLYVVSFLVIIPLAQFLMSTYHLKDTISKVLTEYIEVGEKREQSILEGLNELVLVTDINLKIISANEAVEKSLRLPGQIIGNNLLGVLRLEDENGNEATMQSLYIDKILESRAGYILEGFYLETRLEKHLKVIIQIKPVTNPAGKIDQFAFVITDARTSDLKSHSDLDLAKKRQHVIVENLKKAMDSGQVMAAETQAILLAKANEDIMIAQELEDHPFKKTAIYLDILELCQNLVNEKQILAKTLQVQLKLILPEGEFAEVAYLSLKKSQLSSQALPVSDFSLPLDPKWTKILLEKLIDISALLVAGQPNCNVNVALHRFGDESVEVSVLASPVQIDSSFADDLFKEYFGRLNRTNLRFGSGLEGFITKRVSGELSLPVEVQVSGNVLEFKLKPTKNIS